VLQVIKNDMFQALKTQVFTALAYLIFYKGMALKTHYRISVCNMMCVKQKRTEKERGPVCASPKDRISCLEECLCTTIDKCNDCRCKILHGTKQWPH
jgi:hypothetical protein